jgi:hypothetical protein
VELSFEAEFSHCAHVCGRSKRHAFRGAAIAVALLAITLPADDKGWCIKGAMVGGAAGHSAGHHGLLRRQGAPSATTKRTNELSPPRRSLEVATLDGLRFIRRATCLAELKNPEPTKQAPVESVPANELFQSDGTAEPRLDVLGVTGRQSKRGSRRGHASTPLEHYANRMGLVGIGSCPLIGRIAGRGFQPTNETSALQNFNLVTIDQRFNLPDNIRVFFRR